MASEVDGGVKIVAIQALTRIAEIMASIHGRVTFDDLYAVVIRIDETIMPFKPLIKEYLDGRGLDG